MHIGKNLIVFRHARRLTQKQIARLAGMSQANYSKIESDLQRASPGQIEAFARILGVDAGALLPTSFHTSGGPALSAEAIKTLLANQAQAIAAMQAQLGSERDDKKRLND